MKAEERQEKRTEQQSYANSFTSKICGLLRKMNKVGIRDIKEIEELEIDEYSISESPLSVIEDNCRKNSYQYYDFINEYEDIMGFSIRNILSIVDSYIVRNGEEELIDIENGKICLDNLISELNRMIK